MQHANGVYMSVITTAPKRLDPAKAASVAPSRDRAIDILRGLALLTITVNHLTGLAARGGMHDAVFPTLSHWGFSSAAEIFFLLSGYLVGAVYLSAKRDHGLDRFTRQVLSRAGKLYLYNVLLFLLVLPICMMSPLLARISYLQYFISGGLPSIVQFLAIYVQPFYLEILAVYFLLLVVAPAFAWALLRSPWLALAASGLLYWAAYYQPWLRMPGGIPAGDWKWNFNPASWQLLFFGAMAAGRFGLLDSLRDRVRSDGRWLFAAMALFAVLTLLFIAQEPLGYSVWGQSKVRAGPIRILHAITVCVVVLGLLWRWPSLQSTKAGGYIAAVGRISLQSFVASVVISYATGLIWVEFARSHLGYLLLCVAGMIALLLFAQLHRQFRIVLETTNRSTQPA
jgi:hypothetical protein